ncbi:HD domain-containing protein [Dactylosporangium sp. AC04546]|uniref:HD domain-containing protein n=1 Tax=Dactylosporangium sp. AC04546 TaxID=2862460 RepID=UPI001EDEE32E|nr:HD domain-containing protein [Dactylosporangium sp. AC04546]WVK86209.1 HD domain-containing protein [Dactylosporangium sp. AC04546]
MLSARFEQALAFAARRHTGQVRHNTHTPYVSHLLATCAIVLEEGGDETTAIGALLHDVLEDQPTSRDELRDAFGDDVYRIVHDCTDADADERTRLTWWERKRAHLGRMGGVSDQSLLVIAADKVCSLQSLVDDLHRFGPALFATSARTADELLWNYREVLGLLASRLGDRPVVARLRRLVAEFTELAVPQPR